jgi:aspartyl-tRNA(Asn)/glutamyl-tRNA(Gln) amidotransferase subunit A
VRTGFLGFLERLRQEGYSLTEVELPASDSLVAAYYVIALGEASSNLSRYDGIRFGARPESALFEARLESFYGAVRSAFGAEVRKRLLLGAHVLSSGYRDELYLKACRMRRKVAMQLQGQLANLDFVLTPVATRQAPSLAQGGKMTQAEVYLNDSFTVTANLSGTPAVVLPVGRDSGGAPFSVQLMGRFGEDEALLAQALEIEGWVGRMPT